MSSMLYKVRMNATQLRLFRDMSFYMTQRSMETLVSVMEKSENLTQEMESLSLLAKVANQHKGFQDYMLVLLEKAEDEEDESKAIEMLIPEGHYRLMVLTATMPSLNPESQQMKVTAAKTGVSIKLYAEMFDQIRQAISSAQRVEKDQEPEIFTTMRAPSKFVQ